MKKVWNENSISIPIHSGINYFCIWLFGGAKYQGGDKAEARGTDEQPLSDKPPLTRCGETYKLTTGRSSHWSCSVKKDVLKNFTKFTGKHPWQSFFFNKVAGVVCNFIKKRLRDFIEYLGTTAFVLAVVI